MLRKRCETAAFEKRLDARRKLCDHFDTDPFEQETNLVGFNKHALPLTALIVIPLGWFFGSIRGVVDAELSGFC
jgi:hypothetical protein